MRSIAVAVVEAFIEAINGQDLAAIDRLMSADHVFVDGSGATHGRDEMVKGWPSYYEMFPDYHSEVDCMVHENGIRRTMLVGRLPGRR